MKSRKSLYHRRRFPREIIRHTVWLYYRFCLSYRDVEDLLAERGITYRMKRFGAGVFDSARSMPIGYAVLSHKLPISDTGRMKSEKSLYHRRRFPREIIRHAVWLYYRFCLSYRAVEDLLAERGVNVSYETIRRWCIRFGADYANRLRKRSAPGGDQWFVDEVFVRIAGQQRYVYRAVDQDGQILDILVQTRRNTKAAVRFFRRLLKRQGAAPRRLVTDKLRSYRPARQEVMPDTLHDTRQYANNRAELSHEPTRQRERRMRRFKSIGQAQLFLSVHGTIQNLFAIPRHLLRAKHYRTFRAGAFNQYALATCA